MKIIQCTCAHAEAILAIFNEAILTSAALYEYQPRTPEMIADWFQAKTQNRFPVIGLETRDGVLAGFASYGMFRDRPACKYSVEHSVYVDREFRGQGCGKRLMKELISIASAQDIHTMIGGIDSSNAASIALHEQLGFTHCGTVKEAGFKFGRWLDLEFYQLILPSPGNQDNTP